MERGRFIVLEGPDGSGKSTQCRHLAAYLRAVYGSDQVVETAEPGGTPFGQDMRKALFNHADLTPEAELLLVFADRAQHLKDVIEPALNARKWVVCDRFIDSTYVYQVAAYQDQPELYQKLKYLFTTLSDRIVKRPADTTLVIQRGIQTTQDSLVNRGDLNRLDTVSDDVTLQRAQSYQECAMMQTPPHVAIDGEQTIDEVHKAIRKALGLR